MKYPTVLTIAGSDPSGGAGIQADIKTISACGCYAASAITALTIQNTLGVQAVHPVPTAIIQSQIECVWNDIRVDALKIGMLHSTEVVLMLAQLLRNKPFENVVLDPVMVSTSGHRLLSKEAIQALTEELFPHVRVITPNIPEAEVLLGKQIGRQEELHDAAQQLAEQYQTNIWLKAGHLEAEKLIDIFYDVEAKKIYELPGIRIHTKNTHGTGCTLSSAMAAMLAQGKSLQESALAAKAYMNQAIAQGTSYTIGHGHGPVHHFWNLGNSSEKP